MVHQTRKPSTKALGKRPIRNGVGATPNTLKALTSSADSAVADEETDESSLAQSAGSVQTRLNNKRVLPSRMRRGLVGTTVGTSEIDVNILDTLKRKGENEPLIPARTVFILTTDSSKVPSASTSEIGLNKIANERYFERPEVIRAYKLQQDIQVPDFVQLDEEMVGGRLRARTGEIEAYELSDEAYERRHRKHEMIEKRQRLREKEKLQHEHYKLKERIEQLRNVDATAFLTLPDDVFGTPEGIPSTDLVDGPSLHEAERRRRLMLDVALSLEERYRTLLPPAERKLAEPRHAISRASASAEPSIPDEDIVGPSDILNQDIVGFDARLKPRKLKLSSRRSAQVTPSPSVPPESSRRRRGTSMRTATPLSPPEGIPEEESITITASQSISSRQKKSRSGQRSTRAVTAAPIPPDTASTVSTFTDHTNTSPPSDQNQYILAGHLPRHDRISHTAYEEIPSSAASSASPSLASVMERRRQSTMPQAEQYANANHYGVSAERKPTRKKKLLQYITYNPDLPEHDVNQAMEAPEQPSDTRYDALNGGGATRTERPATLELSLPDHPSTEVEDVEMDEIAPPAWSPAGWEKMPMLPLLDDQSDIYAHLRQLAQPDHEGDIDVVEQREVNETPTADEPVTPPAAPETVADSIIAENREMSLGSASLEPMSKRRRRQSTPLVRREPSSSLPPESLFEPEFLSVISMRSYEIPTSSGKGRKAKPLGSLLATSKHNVEPGRKTGRSVKAFGLEVPPFDIGKEVDFELPGSLVREVASRRVADGMSDAESDGDPPSFADGMAHGEVTDDMFAGSISTGR
ncbi:hypothetical protein ACEPAI_203 [Sanghuangporus weigelae]